MVDFRPVDMKGRPQDLGKDVLLLVVEYDGSSTSTDNGEPVHHLDVQVAMFDGANPTIRRQSNAHLHAGALRPGGSGDPRVPYSSDAMLEIVTAAWQQHDPADTSPATDSTTDQNVYNRDRSRVLGSVYAVRADVVAVPGAGVRIAAGSVRPVDPAMVPSMVMDAQRQACGAAYGVEMAAHDMEMAAIGEARARALEELLSPGLGAGEGGPSL